MSWKKRIALHYEIKNVGLFTIKVLKNCGCDEIITKISPFEYQIDTYCQGTNILTDTRIESNIKNYIGC